MIHSEIRCDNCGKVAPYCGIVRGRWRAHAVRTQAHSMGWNVGLEGGKDFCPHCIYAPNMPPPWRDTKGLHPETDVDFLPEKAELKKSAQKLTE